MDPAGLVSGGRPDENKPGGSAAHEVMSRATGETYRKEADEVQAGEVVDVFEGAVYADGDWGSGVRIIM